MDLVASAMIYCVSESSNEMNARLELSLKAASWVRAVRCVLFDKVGGTGSAHRDPIESALICTAVKYLHVLIQHASRMLALVKGIDTDLASACVRKRSSSSWASSVSEGIWQ